jgi:hypothetical protein
MFSIADDRMADRGHIARSWCVRPVSGCRPGRAVSRAIDLPVAGLRRLPFFLIDMHFSPPVPGCGSRSIRPSSGDGTPTRGQ